MTTIQERMQGRMDSRPDEYTLAWWRDQFEQVTKGYRGLTHAVNCVLAEIEDHTAVVRRLQQQIEWQAQQLEMANAAIGKLQAEVKDLQVKMQQARDAYADLKKKIN